MARGRQIIIIKGENHTTQTTFVRIAATINPTISRNLLIPSP